MVKYLIDKYGFNVFKEFYAQDRYSENESFKHYYGKPAEKILEEWKAYLKRNHSDKIVLKIFLEDMRDNIPIIRPIIKTIKYEFNL